MSKTELKYGLVGVAFAIFVLLTPISPVHIWVFGDDNLCDNFPEYKASKPHYCYLSGSNVNYDYATDNCADGYYSSWLDGWSFECATEQEAFDICMRDMPEEYMIKKGDLYQRTIELNPEHVICATRIMYGYPADLDKFIEEYISQNNNNVKGKM